MKAKKQTKNSNNSKENLTNSKTNDVTHPYIPQKVVEYRPKHGWLSWHGLKSMWKHQCNFPNRFFIIFHRNNGMIHLQHVYIHQDKFMFNDGVYVVDKDYMKWCDALQCYVAQYFESSSLPVDMEFDEKATIDAIKHSLKASKVSANVNPKVLHSTVTTEVIQKLMRGEELEKFMQRVFMISIFVLVGVIGIILILFNKVM